MAKKVLLVLSDETLLAALSKLLQTQGYDIQTASDGEDAWSLFQQQPPGAVVSALRMPNLDGIGLLKRIRAHVTNTNQTPVILLSTVGFSDYEAEAKAHGANAYLYLPLQDLTELVRWIGV
jgi:two-component system chemotaxis sensor kinase CheA